MIEWLIQIELALFYFGNHMLANPVGDFVFPLITTRDYFVPVYGVALLGLLIFGKKRGIITVLFLALVITLADQGTASLIKPLAGRMRPCFDIEWTRLLVDCGSGKSFPSAHAANNFAAAVFIGYFYRKGRPFFLIYASMVAFSRVYVGVHYFSDIIAGGLFGAGIAWGVILLYEFLQRHISLLRLKPPVASKIEAPSA